MPAGETRGPRGPGIACGLLALGCAAMAPPLGAQTAAAPSRAASSPGAAASAPGPAASAPAALLERVEISGTRAGDVQQRRESTAAKIVIGREEIDRFGDATVGDLLKRLPGVTMQGRPGGGGNIRMRGLGNGYTQILLDGQRMPPGFSLDEMAPEQIERIEILRAPTAETGARAIAGTINIVTREGFAKHINDLRLTAGWESSRGQPALSWTRNDVAGAFIYNYSLSAFRRDRRNDSVNTTVDESLADGRVTLDQRETSVARELRHGLQATGRLQWRGEQGDQVTLIPVLIDSAGRTERASTLLQSVGADPSPYDGSATRSSGGYSLARLNAQWNHRAAGGDRFEWKAGFGQSRSSSASLREETIAGRLSRTLADDSAVRDRNLTLGAKFTRLIGGEHQLVAGAEVESNRRDEHRTTVQDGAPLLADFGDDLRASSSRLAAYAQNEWDISPHWAAHAGLRWEGIRTRGDGVPGETPPDNKSSVWTPLLHAVWKPDPAGRDQVRFSLTRSYRAPTLQGLIARPSINSRYPLPEPGDPNPRNPGNTFTQADRAGNPRLKPELATGLDVAVERYLAGGGVISANVFYRAIRDYLRGVTTLEKVSWSAQPRYVSRPQNVGDADTLGLELDARFRLSDVIDGAPKTDVRANASLFRSRVRGVPGPDNRLDQQPDGTLNLGADHRFAGWPLTLGGNLNWTPHYRTRISDAQSAFQGRKVEIDAYALWVFNPTLRLRVTASNLDPRAYVTGAGAVDLDAGIRETSTSRGRTWLNLQARLELKL